MDKIYLDNPTYGVLRMQDELGEQGYFANEKRIALDGVRSHLTEEKSQRFGQFKVCLSLPVKRSADYPPQSGLDDRYFTHTSRLYVPDGGYVYSRYLVGWNLPNTLAQEVQVELINECIKMHGKPAIINSDQGSQHGILY